MPIRFPCPFSPHPKRSFRLVWCDLVKCRVKLLPLFLHLQLPPYSLDLLRAVATFWRFWCGKWHERCSLFPIVPCERQRCCSACSVWILQFERRVRRHHSRCPFFSAIRARVMFSCFRFLPCLGFEELHLLCMFHLGIAEYFLPRCVFPFLP